MNHRRWLFHLAWRITLAKGEQVARPPIAAPGLSHYSALLTKRRIGAAAAAHGIRAATVISQTKAEMAPLGIERGVIHAMKKAAALQRFYYKMQRKKAGKVTEVAAARKLLQGTYHMMRDGITFPQLDRKAEFCTENELVNRPGI